MVLGKTRPVHIEDEMRSSYLDYAMSVIISRALPNVRDGLKPVQRRILYAMGDMGINANGPFRKSARIIGEVIGKYHPHSEAPIYEAMVRLAQDFSMRYVLVDGQGNFGSVDNDPPAAMRYTEARLTVFSEQMLLDIDRDTVDFTPNFDDSLQEPVVLPTQLPNLLVNGSSGIAVGMATNIPPHNLGEVCDAIAYLIDNKDATVEELCQFVKGPDFPTAGIIIGQEGIRSAYATGHGRIVVRAKAHIGDSADNGHRQIVVSELPYQVNKAALIEKIASLVSNKKISGISELRDESDRQGMRIVIELKRDAQPQQVLNTLYKQTAMQSAFSVNMLALVDGQPRVISLKEALQYFIDFRQEVITRRSRFELKGARSRAHILEGFKIALDQLDKIIATIRKSETAERARQSLMSDFELSQAQAQAILDMQLRRLANLEQRRILDEYAEVLKNIAYLEEIIANPRRILHLIKDEVAELKSKLGDPRRTEISMEGEAEFQETDLIPHQKVVVTLSNRGYVKRMPADFYSPQHRGGKGIIGMVTRDNDTVRLLVTADTHDNLLFFTNRGRVFSLKCHEVPDSSRTARGLAVINLIPITERERVTDVVVVPEFKRDTYLLMATLQGEIKRTSLDNFAVVRSSGLIAMDVPGGDGLVAARLAQDSDDVLMVTQKGQSIRFAVASIRASLRTSGGVRGVRLGAGDQVVGMEIAHSDSYLLAITTEGYGKITPISSYPKQHRAGSGVRTYKITAKTGNVASVKLVSLSHHVMMISAEGNVILTPVREKDPKKGIAEQGRSTQGVRLMRLDEDDQVVSVTCLE